MAKNENRPVWEALQQEYSASLREYAAGAGETALARAYEIGRLAAGKHVTLLDIVKLHEHASLAIAEEGSGAALAAVLVRFLAEALSPYEMALRAHRENTRLLGLGGIASRIDDELDRAREQLRAILDATTAVIYLRDTAGRFLFVNRRFENVFGAKRELATGALATAALPASVDTTLLTGDRSAIEHRKPQEVEETIPLSDGVHTFLSLKVPLLDSDGVPYAVCCVATDITERRRAAEAVQRAKEAADEAYRQLRATQTQLVQSAKMASLGELVAGIAHEINNPLAFALSHLETTRKSLTRVESATDLSPDVRSDWDRATVRLLEMAGGLERIRDLVLKLRTFSRLDEGEWKRVSVRECIESVLMILGHRLKDRIQVDLQLESIEPVDCYPSLLNQAIMNLLANAIDVSPDGGMIAIRAECRNDGFAISIRDGGPGIPAELRDRVFEPFFTTKPPGEGTGLGLSITDSIARKHGGTLEIDCPLEGGTVVTLWFPKAGAKPP